MFNTHGGEDYASVANPFSHHSIIYDYLEFCIPMVALYSLDWSSTNKSGPFYQDMHKYVRRSLTVIILF